MLQENVGTETFTPNTQNGGKVRQYVKKKESSGRTRRKSLFLKFIGAHVFFKSFF